MENNTFNVAVLGAGNIGSAVVARLMDLDKGIVGLNVKKVLVKDKTLESFVHPFRQKGK